VVCGICSQEVNKDTVINGLYYSEALAGSGWLFRALPE